MHTKGKNPNLVGKKTFAFFAEEKPTVFLPTKPTIRFSRCAAGKKRKTAKINVIFGKKPLSKFSLFLRKNAVFKTFYVHVRWSLVSNKNKKFLVSSNRKSRNLKNYLTLV